MSKITHSKSGNVIHGEYLQIGDILKDTDVFESTTGLWRKCPCPGCIIRDLEVTWVRPLEVE